MSGTRSKLSKDIAIIGIGQGKFGKRSDASLRELAFEAVKACLEDASVNLEEVESMVTGICSGDFLSQFSLLPKYMTTSGSTPNQIFVRKQHVLLEAWR